MDVKSPAAIVVLGPSALDTARRVAAALPGARIHGAARRVPGADHVFADAAPHLRALFAGGVPVIGVCAAGILIRALAPLLRDKGAEPPVIAVAEDASAVVPLLGGHRGGNDLAGAIATALNIAPAVTTAGDLRLKVALDNPPPGWVLTNPEHVKGFVADLLAGETVRVTGATPFLADADLDVDPHGNLRITVGMDTAKGAPGHLVYCERSLAMGIGCERGAPLTDLRSAAMAACESADLPLDAVAGIFSLDLKMDEPALHALAAELGLPLRFFDAATLEAETPRLASPSDAVFRAVGCHGVAEGAALAAAGPQGRLVAAKTTSGRATSALAAAPRPIDAAATARARGHLAVVGIGPGDGDSLTPHTAALLARAEHAVGYGLYLDLVAARLAGVARHSFGLGEEALRVRHALDLAASGHRVALVSSGDPGIYAMASLVFEEVDRSATDSGWRRIDIEVAPGISAFQAAAARAGAPMGHDFCLISLSDLMTPWAIIEKRLAAVADADFVVALYNPASKRRDWQFEKARSILLRGRPGGTPAVVARNLGRAGESVKVTTLGGIDAASLDMLTLVIVGAPSSRVITDANGAMRVYTPRGYGGDAP